MMTALRMADNPKGRFSADIPDDIVSDAMKSVEKPKVADEVPIEEGEAPAPTEVTSLKAQLEASQEMGRQTMEKLRDTHERFLRASADLENYKKRALKERDE